MISLNTLVVTQNTVRCADQIIAMTRFARHGGHFTKDALIANAVLSGRTIGKLMRIAVLPDGREVLCDGLHRAVAKCYAGVDYVRGDEVVITKLTLDDFRRPAIDKGWFTPFDPETEVRLPDFGSFRSEVLRLIDEGQEVASFINENRRRYAEPRSCWTVGDVANNINRAGSVCYAEAATGCGA